MYRPTVEKAPLELNSPKYQMLPLSEIMNLTKSNNDQNDKAKKLKVVRTTENAMSLSKKDVTRVQTSNRIKPQSVRSSV